MDQLHTANKVCGGCCAISLNTVDTESSVSPIFSYCLLILSSGPNSVNITIGLALSLLYIFMSVCLESKECKIFFHFTAKISKKRHHF